MLSTINDYTCSANYTVNEKILYPNYVNFYCVNSHCASSFLSAISKYANFPSMNMLKCLIASYTSA